MKLELHKAHRELQKITADLAPEEREKLEDIVKSPYLPPISQWPLENDIKMPKVAITEEESPLSLFNSELGFMLPETSQTFSEPKRRVIYRHRTIVETNRQTSAPRLRGPSLRT